LLESVHPNLLAFFAAFLIGATQGFYRKALGQLSPALATLLVNLVLGVLSFCLYLIEGGPERWPVRGLLWFALVGFLGSYAARYLNYISYTFIGMARTQVLAQVHPVWASFFAVMILGETLSLPVGVGTFGIVFGAILLVYERRFEADPVPLARYALPLISALMIATTPTFRKFAFAWIPSVPLGIAVASATAFVAQSVHILVSKRETFGTWEGRAVGILATGAFVNTFSNLMFWKAIKNGAVVEVVPIRRLSILFVLLFSWMFFRRLERVTLRVAAGGLLTVAGAAAIAWGR